MSSTVVGGENCQFGSVRLFSSDTATCCQTALSDWHFESFYDSGGANCHAKILGESKPRSNVDDV